MQETKPSLNSYAKIVVPLIPVSVNHYWDLKIVRGKIFAPVSPEAKAFMDAIAIFRRGQQVFSEKCRAKPCSCKLKLVFKVYLGKGDRGDTANFEKGIGDGLVKAGIIHSDNSIIESHQYKFRDWDKPRTEIEVFTL
jgi:Holliday junction resolvase RusA-like endonuclease